MVKYALKIFKKNLQLMLDISIGLKEQNSAGKRKNDVILYKIKVTIQNH